MVADRNREPDMGSADHRISTADGVDIIEQHAARYDLSDFAPALAAGVGVAGGLLAASAAGTNFLANGGFESGDTSGCVITGATTSGVDGSFITEGSLSAFVTVAGGGNAVFTFDPANVIGGQAYTVSANIYQDGGASFLYSKYTVSWYDINGTLIYTSSSVAALNRISAWITLGATLISPGAAVTAVVVVSVACPAAITCHLDNVFMGDGAVFMGSVSSAPEGITNRRVSLDRNRLHFYSGHPNELPQGDAGISVSEGTDTAVVNNDQIKLFLFGADPFDGSNGPTIVVATKNRSGTFPNLISITDAAFLPMAGIQNATILSGSSNSFNSTVSTTFQNALIATVLASPNLSVDTAVLVTATCRGSSSFAAAVNMRLRVGISIDGGATFTFSQQAIATVGNVAGASQNVPLAATFSVTGVPTGSIQLAVQCETDSASFASYTFSAIMWSATTMPVP